MGAQLQGRLAELLLDYPFVIDMAIRWGDMDSMGHVNNTVYFRFFESARLAYRERLGFPPLRPDQSQFGVILGATSCRFRAATTYPDTLSIGVRVTALGYDRFLMEHRAVSHRMETVVAEGDALIVSYDYVGSRVTPLAQEFRDAIIALEGHEPPPLPACPQ